MKTDFVKIDLRALVDEESHAGLLEMRNLVAPAALIVTRAESALPPALALPDLLVQGFAYGRPTPRQGLFLR